MHCLDKDKISRDKLEGGDYAGLLALFNRMCERVARALGMVPTVVSCYEAGYDGFWLHRLLTEAGLRTMCSTLRASRWISGLGE